MWEYSQKVWDHFNNPKNMGDLPNANAIGQVGSIVCGDALKLYLKIENGRIVDARFKTFGCASAIASSSVLTEIIKGKSIEDALKITNEDIARELDGLPAEKMHCSVMGREALEAAIANYRGQAGHAHKEDEGRVVCRCFGVTDTRIRRHIIENRLRTVQAVTNYTKAGGGCTSCHADIQDIIDDVWKHELSGQKATQSTARTEAQPQKTMNTLQKITSIQHVLEEEIKPALAMDGGSIELIDVEGNIVKVKLHGACGTCASGSITLKGYVERVLQEKVLPELQVVQVK